MNACVWPIQQLKDTIQQGKEFRILWPMISLTNSLHSLNEFVYLSIMTFQYLRCIHASRCVPIQKCLLAFVDFYDLEFLLSNFWQHCVDSNIASTKLCWCLMLVILKGHLFFLTWYFGATYKIIIHVWIYS